MMQIPKLMCILTIGRKLLRPKMLNRKSNRPIQKSRTATKDAAERYDVPIRLQLMYMREEPSGVDASWHASWLYSVYALIEAS